MLSKLKAYIQGSPSADAPATAPATGPCPAASHAPVPRPAGAHPLDRLRFGLEERLLNDIRQKFALDQLVDHLFDSGELAPFHQAFLAQQVRLTPLMAPRLTRIFDDVRSRLGFDEKVDLYVFAQESINAVSIFRTEDDEPHAISLTSGAVKSMNDDELRFALGHEIGHIHFRHAKASAIRVAFGGDDESQERGRQIPPLLERRLDAWGRLCEISADRVGFQAAEGALGTAVCCFFKMASGLGPEHLNFDLDAFLAQLDHLASMERREVMAKFSHPITPVRARALQLYADRTLGPGRSIEDVDADIAKITSLMDFEVSTDIGVQAREFLIAAGLLAAHADGEMSDEEQNVVVQLLLQVTGDPEQHLAKVRSTAEAQAMLDRSCEWLVANAGQERFALYSQVAHIVAVDGKLSDREREFMLGLAKRLGIPERSAREVIHEVLSRVVRTRTGTRTGGVGWGLAREP